MTEYDVAVVGATGAVGETMLRVLEERRFPVGKIYPLASERSVGQKIVFRDEEITVQNLADFDFSQADIGLFSAGASVSKTFAPKAAQAGCVVIDNTSCFRYEPDVALVVPEVNPHKIADFKKRGIIANPNCSTIQMVVALKPIYDVASITRINVATYQAVSGAGRKAIEALFEETRAVYTQQSPDIDSPFPDSIAFNVIPQIDVFLENGYTKEEMKMVWETRKILEDDNIAVNPTCVRVPVFYGHSEAVHVETKEKITAQEVRALLKQAPGVIVLDEPMPKGYPTPRTHASGQDAVFVGRIREDISCPCGIDLWIVADNVRKGAATNSVQIAELLLGYL
jgi:aspartate-semialdehyde dehydrogenase